MQSFVKFCYNITITKRGEPHMADEKKKEPSDKKVEKTQFFREDKKQKDSEKKQLVSPEIDKIPPKKKGE